MYEAEIVKEFYGIGHLVGIRSNIAEQFIAHEHGNRPNSFAAYI